MSSSGKIFWGFVNSFCQSHQSSITLSRDTAKVSEPDKMDQLISTEYFSSVYFPDSPKKRTASGFGTPFVLSECPMTVEPVNSKFVALDPSKEVDRTAPFCSS